MHSSLPAAQQSRSRPDATNRAQASLPAFAIAVLVVTSTATLAILVADGAFGAADREPLERTHASGLADAMVADTSPMTIRANVVNETSVSALDTELETWFPSASGLDFAVTLGGTLVAERGDPTGGTTVRRLVLVAEPHTRTLEPTLTSSDQAVTLPRRASSVNVTLAPPAGTTVSTVRVNDRVVLHDPIGLSGTYAVPLSRFETTSIDFNASGPLPQGSVRLTYRPVATEKAVLEVTVDG